MRRPQGRTLGLLAVAALLAAFYVWVASTSGPLFGHRDRGPYGKLADAFLHGQLHLRQAPPPGLEKVSDPYDPRQNLGYLGPGVGDLSYYRGRLYAYWGPVPVLLFYLPAQAVGIELSDSLVALLLGLAGLAVWAAVVHLLVRALPRPPPSWMEPVALLAVGAGDYVPFLLRLSRVYEIAIASGVCFAGLGTLMLVVALRRPRLSPGLLAAASAAFGLAFASRAPLLALGAPLAALVLVARRREPDAGRGRIGSLAAALLLPFAACVVAYAFYNRARFGSFAEFGVRYQLSSFDLHDRAYFRPRDMVEGLAAYVATPVRLVAQFPFAWPQIARVPVPNGFYAEDRAGLLAVAPFVLCLGAVWWVRERVHRVAIATLAAGAAVVAALTALAVAGSPVRYAADFTPALLAGAAVAWCAAGARRGRAPRRWRRAGAILAALTALAGVLVSASVEEALLRNRPSQFAWLERRFSFVPRAISLFVDRPILMGIDHRPRPDPDAYPTNDFDAKPEAVLRVASPGDDRVAVAYRVRPAFSTGAPPAYMAVVADGARPLRAPFDAAGAAVTVPVHGGVTRIAIRNPTGRPVVFEHVDVRRPAP